MEIQRFDASKIPGKDRYLHKFSKISQLLIDSYNQQGYKLYYYKDFDLIEINDIKKEERKIKNKTWGGTWDIWGDQIFFLNQEEYDLAMRGIKSSKDLYDKHIEAANLLKQVPMSAIYHNILKVPQK